MNTVLLDRLLGVCLVGLFFMPWFQLDRASATGQELLVEMTRQAALGFKSSFTKAGDPDAWLDFSTLIFFRRTALSLVLAASGGLGLVLAPRRWHRLLVTAAMGGLLCLVIYWTALYFASRFDMQDRVRHTLLVVLLLEAFSVVPLVLGVTCGAGLYLEKPWAETLSRVLRVSVFLVLVLPSHPSMGWSVRAEALLLAWAYVRSEGPRESTRLAGA